MSPFSSKLSIAHLRANLLPFEKSKATPMLLLFVAILKKKKINLFRVFQSLEIQESKAMQKKGRSYQLLLLTFSIVFPARVRSYTCNRAIIELSNANRTDPNPVPQQKSIYQNQERKLKYILFLRQGVAISKFIF